MVSYVKQNYLKFKYWLLFHIKKKKKKERNKKNNLSYINKTRVYVFICSILIH